VVRRDAPVVTLMTQSDVLRTLWMRRPDSDDENDVYRLYEITGAAHVGPFGPGLPSAADLAIAGVDPSTAVPDCAEPPSTYPVGMALNAIWVQLDDLLVRGQPLGRVARVDVDATGQLVLDAQGNVQGGLRLPQLDVPLAAYAGTSTPRVGATGSQPLCAFSGSMRRFDVPTLKAAYGTRAAYLKRFNAAVDAAVAARGLDPADAPAAKAAAAKAAPAF
jgi:hypothetical protein